MIFSAVVVVSALSLLTSARAATIHGRRDGCTFVCPDKDLDSNTLHSSSTGEGVISCSYFGKSFNSCTYDSTSGAFLGDGDCPQHAAQKCIPRRSRELKQAVVRRGAPDEYPDPNAGWKPHGSPSPGPKRDVPPTTSVWPPYPPPSSWYPSPSKPKPSYPPSTPQPCKFRCPQQDLAKNQLTDEAIREPSLFCSYSTPYCKTCSFCEYNTKTGLLVQDNDDGNCPQTASATRPWDRRYA